MELTHDLALSFEFGNKRWSFSLPQPQCPRFQRVQPKCIPLRIALQLHRGVRAVVLAVRNRNNRKEGEKDKKNERGAEPIGGGHDCSVGSMNG